MIQSASRCFTKQKHHMKSSYIYFLGDHLGDRCFRPSRLLTWIQKNKANSPPNSNCKLIFLPDEFLLQITGVKMHGLQQIIFEIKM